MRARLLLLAGALVAFGASLGSGFHFDDYAIFSNPTLTSLSGWLDIWSLRQTRPLTYLTFWLNYLLGGRDPLGYHLLNLALHVGAVLLAFECLRRLVPERIALFAAAVFAVHPIQAESVDYVWGRSIVLASLLTLASLYSLVKGQRWLAVAWFLAALLAKEEVAAFPLVLLLLDRRESKRNWAPIGCMLALALAAAARVIYATAVTPGAPAGLQAGISPWNYLLAQSLVILRYLRLLAIPYGFSVDPAITIPTIWLGIGAWLLLLGLLAFSWQRGEEWAGWLIAGFLLLMPSSSLFPAADLSADRRMYLPLLAFAVAAGLLLERVRQPMIPVAIVAVFAILGATRTMVWMTDEALWREAMERAPQKVRPRIQLARALPAAAALEILAQARNLAPNDPAVAAETGKTLLAEGQPEAALQEFGRALALDPKDASNLNNRGVALQAIGQTEAARADFERALTIDPTLSEARLNLQKLPAR